jgi:hypothetical protein
MRLYLAARTEWGAAVLVRDGEDDPRALPSRRDLHDHSPTGFEWGYEGSGPAQLALAILADCTKDDAYALEKHQDFKRWVVARMPKEGWVISAADVMRALTEMQREAW